MEEIIARLRSLSHHGAFSIPLPDDDDLVEAEEALLLPLPRELEQFLLHVSDCVYGTIEPVTLTDPQLHTHLPEVTAVAWDLGLPRHLVPICEHRGEYYAVDENNRVWHWANGELSEAPWESVWDWVQEVWLGETSSKD